MNCTYSREILALLIENDLPVLQMEDVRRHVSKCMNCQENCRQLEESQSLIKGKLGSRFEEPPSDAMLAAVRQTVSSRIGSDAQALGWTLALERTFLLGFRRHAFAFASLLLLGVVSASLLAEMRYGGPGNRQPASVMFEGRDVLLRPARYRDWIFVGTSANVHYLPAREPATQNIYVNPEAYKEFAKTGVFPDGTVMILERVRAGREPFALQASVKDSGRFAGGWGFFDFTAKDGEIAPKAEAQPDGTCRPCHELHGQTDHVFTQFYPALRSARVES